MSEVRLQDAAEVGERRELAPGRKTLSGAPISPLGKAVPQPAAATPPESRKCANCGIADCASPIEGEFDERGNQKIEHLVTVELRYLKVNTEAEAKKRITAYLKGKGWRYRLHQGKHAMERFVCRPCLRALAVMERDWARKADQDNSKNKESYYGLLCNDSNS